VARSNDREMAPVERREGRFPEPLAERHDRGVDESKTQVLVCELELRRAGQVRVGGMGHAVGAFVDVGDEVRPHVRATQLDEPVVDLDQVAPTDRAGVRRFLSRFGGQELEVALEATTGWRFVVEELRRVGAQVHLAEPAETSAREGSKKRAKTDRHWGVSRERSPDGSGAEPKWDD